MHLPLFKKILSQVHHFFTRLICIFPRAQPDLPRLKIHLPIVSTVILRLYRSATRLMILITYPHSAFPRTRLYCHRAKRGFTKAPIELTCLKIHFHVAKVARKIFLAHIIYIALYLCLK